MHAFTKRFAAAFFAALLALLAGCASVPMTSTEGDAKGKSFAVAPGKANIYVYRNETLGAAFQMTVTLNGRVAGRSAAQTYFLFEVDPGIYEVGSIAENTVIHKLIAQAGNSYFVWQEVKMGLWMARSELRQVDEATGRKGVAECKRAQPTS